MRLSKTFIAFAMCLAALFVCSFAAPDRSPGKATDHSIVKSVVNAYDFSSVAFSAADTTIPRFGTTTNQDNTGRIMTWRYYVATDATGADTANLVPRAYETIVQYTATDSLCFSAATTYAYVGDVLKFIILNSSGSGHQIKFSAASAVIGTSSNWQMSSSGPSMTLTASKRALISFIFDGTYWVENGRMAQ